MLFARRPMTVPLLLTFFVLLACSAFCSLSEAAFLAVNKVRLRHLVQRGVPSAKVVYQLLTQLDRLITTLLVSNNFISVAISVLGGALCVDLLGHQRGLVVATVAITLILLVVAEITPKLFAAAHADRVALTFAVPLQGLIQLMSPVTGLFTGMSYWVIRLLGGQRLPRSPLVTEEELKVMIEMGREAGVVAEHELRMLHRIFEFDDTLVKDVMVPRAQIVGVDITDSPEAALDAFIEAGHSRIPVYRGSLDRIEGVLYAQDLLAVWRHGRLFVLPDLVRPAYRVPETKRVAELLADFQRLRIQIAIVQSHASVTVGLVTVEDLLEEIVGEMHEEAPRLGRRPA
ncbi:MAG: HlyC/CorC family transporter [Candidatus Omnitrophica bacterium]|nr:HlyC/CorC family transporter [Candidatus Omnitrophota bacterium]